MTTLTPDSTPAEVRKAWAERLRNPGNIVQGAGQLADGQERCCLGVLCDLAVEAGVIEDYRAWNGWPPPVVDAWAALDGTYQAGVSGLHDNLEQTMSLLGLNDTDLTFADIADLLDDGLVLGPDGNMLEV